MVLPQLLVIVHVLPSIHQRLQAALPIEAGCNLKATKTTVSVTSVVCKDHSKPHVYFRINNAT